eukprot:2377843-Rhodomonas_salina.1
MSNTHIACGSMLLAYVHAMRCPVLRQGYRPREWCYGFAMECAGARGRRRSGPSAPYRSVTSPIPVPHTLSTAHAQYRTRSVPHMLRRSSRSTAPRTCPSSGPHTICPGTWVDLY